jgi:phosphoribosylanthranilate isomerase
VIVQIYTVQTLEEAAALADIGVDQIGITPTQLGLPGEVTVEQARSIFAALGTRAAKVALSVDSDVNAIADMVHSVQPDILHLCGDIELLPPAAVAGLAERLPGTQILQAIPMTGPAAVGQARAFATVADMLILDSDSAEIGGIGATGEVHDWRLSRQIVEELPIPVILAGGLSPENVAAAIDAVRPWGVDSLTHTNTPTENGRFRKDLDRVEAFVRAARGLAPAITPTARPARP